MRTGTTGVVALVVSDISNPLFATIAKSADEALSPRGYSLMVANSSNDPAHPTHSSRPDNAWSAVFVPEKPLEPGATYLVEFAARRIGGEPLDWRLAWTFVAAGGA